MAWEIVKSTAGGKKGYRVRSSVSGDYMSKEALPLAKAKAQRTAIILSELGINRKAKNMREGGLVMNTTGHPPVEGKPKDFGDTVPCILEVGEVVIPVEHADKVIKFLKKEGIRLPNM